MPLQLFGSLLDFSFLGIFLLRIGLGAWFLASGFWLLSGKRLWTDAAIAKNAISRAIGLSEFVAGILLFLGVFTQAGALVGLLISLSRLWRYRKHSARVFLFLLLSLGCLAQMTFGPGPFSIDLPL